MPTHANPPAHARFSSTGSSADGHAIVIGGSMAGLLAARVLSDYFGRVTLIERDRLPGGYEDRKGVPQGRHAHALLAGGREAVERMFPGLVSELVSGGATSRDTAANGRWFQPGGYRPQFESGVRAVSASRPFLEGHIRRRMRSMENVTFREGRSVVGLLADESRGRVTGVALRRDGEADEEIGADLVVDAGGRGSRAPAWLEKLGYERPPAEEIRVGIGYTTRIYRQRPEDLPGATYSVIQATPPHQTRLGVLLPLEGGRWMVTLGGFLGDHAPTDEQGFLAFARSLPAPDIHKAIRNAEPLGGAKVHKFPSNLRRRYERLERFPEGYLVTGDALCSFNPIYAQGMSVSALEAAALEECLKDGLEGLPGRFYRRASRVIDTPWQLAAGADLAYPDVEGVRTRSGKIIGRYVAEVLKTATRDEKVCLALIKVTNLLEPPGAFFRPGIVARVIRNSITNRSGGTVVPPAEGVPEAA